MKATLFGLIAIGLAMPAQAQLRIGDIDTESCRWLVNDWGTASKKRCDEAKALERREKELEDERRKGEEIMRQKAERREADRQAALEEQRERERKYAEERSAEQAALRQELAEQERKERAAARAAEAREKIVKDHCRDDYRNPQIGMTLRRAQECLGKLRLTSQVNRVDGVLSTYENNQMFIHVMGNRVVSWGRYP